MSVVQLDDELKPVPVAVTLVKLSGEPDVLVSVRDCGAGTPAGVTKGTSVGEPLSGVKYKSLNSDVSPGTSRRNVAERFLWMPGRLSLKGKAPAPVGVSKIVL